MLTERLIHPDFRDLATVQAEHEGTLLALPNVVGVALGHKFTKGSDTGKKCLLVMVDMKLDKNMLTKSELVPTTIGSVPTDVVQVGVVQTGSGPVLTTPSATDVLDALTWEWEHPVLDDPSVSTDQRDRFALGRAARAKAGLPSVAPQPLAAARIRPAVGGVSIGHYRGAAGTLGICCIDTATSVESGAPGRVYLLSNNHVLANCNDASVGDPILQPAPADGGTPATDTIARLTRFVPLKFGRTREHVPLNYVDAAIAEGRFDQLDRRIHWIGEVRQEAPAPKIGDRIGKSGRASHYTTGTVFAVNATITVNYPGGRTARFAKQIVSLGLSTGGDSGAVVVDTEQRAVGLLFATSPMISVLNPIVLVEQLLGVRITEPSFEINGRRNTQR
jgi:hypothetical protein